MASTGQSLQLADFMDLFTGNIHNYGVHIYNFVDDGKEAGKNQTATNQLLTVDQYKAHLEGKVGLGIIPIDDTNKVKFGVIDIDVYDTDLTPYIEAIERNNFPLVPFRSKSGGLHLYLFMKQRVEAKTVITLLNQLAAVLSLDMYVKHKLNRILEIFPKQSKVAEGNTGSWINLPYYNARETRQYCLLKGKALSFDDALAYVKEKRRSVEEVNAFLNELDYSDGPPCLQTITLLQATDANSGRNNFLFSFGVYIKKKDPEFWEQKLFDLNRTMREPLPADEVEGTIINSLRKKDYAYKCNEAPCVDFCRKPICKKRDFGVGKEGGYFSELEYGHMIQVKAYEPYYEWEVRLPGDTDYKLLRFKNEQDIIGQDAFLRLCFRELHTLPIKMKQSEWFKLINQALSEIIIEGVEKEDDTSPVGLLKLMLVEFLTDRAMAQTKDQILNKRVYFDKKTGKYYFRTADLSDFVFIMKGFRYFAPSELHGLLKDFKAVPTRIKTESGKQLRVYEIATPDLENIGSVTAERFKAEFKDPEEKF